jgi:hypothetical protein
MADNPQTLSTILTALAQNFRPKIVRTVNRRSVLTKVLPVVKGEGKNIAVDVEFTGAIAEAANDGDDVVNYGSDALSPATLPWAIYRSNFRVGDVAMAAAASSLTPLSVQNLWVRNLVNGATALASAINLDLYSGNGGASPPHITGLDTALLDNNTYMGIDRTQSGNATFRGNVIDPGSPTAPTLSSLRKDINTTIYTACGEQPDIAMCGPAVFNTIGDLFTELRRYNQGVTEIETAKGKIVLDASIGAIEFEGCVFIKDKDATANEIFYLNSNYVRIEYLDLSPMADVMSAGDDLDLEDGFGPVPLGARFKKLATTGASEKATMEVALNIVVEKPNTCGIRKNVLTT